MTKSRIFLYAMVSFLCGAGVGFFFSKTAFAAMSAATVLSYLIWRKFHFKTAKIHMAVWVCLFFFLMGILRFLLTVPEFGPRDLAFYRDMDVDCSVQGAVAGEPDVRADFIYLVLAAEKISCGGEMIDVSGNLLLKVPRYPEYSFGERLAAKGKILSPPVLQGFSYGDRLAKDGIFAVMYRPYVEVKGKYAGMSGWPYVYWLKDAINSRINEILGEPVAGLVAGILLGLRRSIPDKVMNDFNATGLTHILAISGYNITLLISVFTLILKKSGRRSRFAVSLAGIVLFSILTGLSSSVIRAALMGALVLTAVFFGRKSAGKRGLVLSAALMALANPRVLLFDMSFQLSFLATLGILIYMPLIEDKAAILKKLPAFIGEGLCVTLSAQVLTIPLILYSFGRISLIAPVTNIVFLPMVPSIMFFAFLGLVSSFLCLPLTALMAGITWILCRILVDGVAFFASLPLAALSVSGFPLWLMLAYYGLAAFTFFRKPRSVRCS